MRIDNLNGFRKFLFKSLEKISYKPPPYLIGGISLCEVGDRAANALVWHVLVVRVEQSDRNARDVGGFLHSTAAYLVGGKRGMIVAYYMVCH